MPGAPSMLDELQNAAAALTASGEVTIDAAAVEALAKELSAEAVAAAARAGFPVKFDSVEAEVTFLALYRLLDFGGEHDAALHAAAKRGARETMQFGALGLHLGAKKLDFHFMKDFSAFSVSNYFGFEPRVDHELQPGITISKPGPLAPLADAIKGAMQAAGAALEKAGARTLGGYILARLDARQADGEPALAAAFVSDLAEAFSGFDDVGTAGGTRLPFYRKAQALAADLYARFGGGGGSSGGSADAAGGEGSGAGSGAGGSGDPRFAWQDAGRIAGDSSPAAVAAWRLLGVVQLPERLAAAVEGGGTLTGEDEALVRAAAVAAADAVARAAGGSFTPAALGAWAAAQVDEGGRLHGKAQPFVTPGTVAF